MVVYEVDLFGCVCNNIDVVGVDVECVEVLYCVVCFLLQVDVVQMYFSLCMLDVEEVLLVCMLVGCEEVFKLVQCCFNMGDIGELDVVCVDVELVMVCFDCIGV